MYACPYDPVTHFLGWSGAQNWLFCLKFGCNFGRNDTVLTTRVSYAIRGSSDHSHTSEGGEETLKQQWMSILMTRCLISRLTWYPRNWSFYLDPSIVFSRKDTLLTIRVYYMLADALPNILIYLMDVQKHSRSNACLFLWHRVTFPWLMWCSKLVILLEIWAFILVETTLWWP